MNDRDAGTLRARKDFWFACVDIDVIRDKELSQSAKFIFAVLCTFVTLNNRGCWPSNDIVAEAAGVSTRTVIRAYQELEARGVIARSVRFKEGAQTSSYTRIVGHNAECYDGVSEVSAPHDMNDAPPMTQMAHKGNQIKDITYSLTREAELPDFADMPLAFKDKEPVIPDEDKEKPLSKQEDNPEEVCTPDDAPDIMRPTAEYLLLKTGRKKLTWPEISALRTMAASQYPSRVQKEIDTACERFTRKGRNLKTLTFCYIAGSLQHQKSRFPAGRKGKKAQGNTSNAPQSEIKPSTRTFTDNELDELEALVREGRCGS